MELIGKLTIAIAAVLLTPYPCPCQLAHHLMASRLQLSYFLLGCTAELKSTFII